MKSLALAVLVCFGGIILICLVLTSSGLFSLTESIQIAAVAAGLIALVHKQIENYKPSAGTFDDTAIPSFLDYQLPTYQVIVYGTMIVFAAINASGFLSGFSVAFVTNFMLHMYAASGLAVPAISYAIVQPVVGWLNLFFLLIFCAPILFIVGAWMGRRARSQDRSLVFAVALLATVLDALAAVATLHYTGDYDKLSMSSVSFWSVRISVITLLVLISLSIGFRRGNRQRISAYLDYLVHQVSPEARNAIVDLVHQEASMCRRSIAPMPVAPVPRARSAGTRIPAG